MMVSSINFISNSWFYLEATFIISQYKDATVLRLLSIF